MSHVVLQAARDLAPLIARNAGKQPDQPMPRESVDALVAAGLFGVMTPRDVGGAELPLLDTLDVFAEVARADGSAGWCLMAGASAVAHFGAYCSDAFVERAFASGVPLVAGQFFPNGTATEDGDGYRINGQYQFGSGISHSDWAAVGAWSSSSETANPEMICAMIPIDQAEVKGNWDVLGLQATASCDYNVTDVQVPRSATFKLLAPMRHRGGPTYDLGVLPLTAVGHAGFAVGVVRRALDELVEVAKTKQRMGAPTGLADSEYFLQRLGTLEGRFRSAHAWVRQSFERLEQGILKSGVPDPVLANAVRQATVHVTQDGAAIVQDAYRLAGTSSLRAGALERCFRDIHAGSQHFFASPTPTLDFARDLMAAASGPTASAGT
jgi:alkylation response protein AidB-like acyl-CoA dehydrogenase